MLYDAVALMPGEAGVPELLKNAAVKDFVSDAFAHLKFIGYIAAAMPLFEKAGIAADLDAGCIILGTSNAAKEFVTACRKLRRWAREQYVKT